MPRGDLEEGVAERGVARRARRLETGGRDLGNAQRGSRLRAEMELPLAGLADDVADVDALDLPRPDPRVGQGVETGLGEQLRAGVLVLAELRHAEADDRHPAACLRFYPTLRGPERVRRMPDMAVPHLDAGPSVRPFRARSGSGPLGLAPGGMRPLRDLPRSRRPATRRRGADRIRQPRPGACGDVPPALRGVRGVRVLRGGCGRPARRRARRVHPPPPARGDRAPGRRARQGHPSREADRADAPGSRRHPVGGALGGRGSHGGRERALRAGLCGGARVAGDRGDR